MASSDLIDFNIIEDHKENIQALPSGRSAKALAALYSPPLTNAQHATVQDQHSSARAEFEEELELIEEADDPLDIYDRYVKWTLETYPSAQSTPQSQLLPLLERATKAFLTSTNYKNDPRYLKLWLHYIRFFSDAPRETFIFLSRNGVGESLALYYEEYAAWLESAGRWTQADEVYRAGIEKEAHPTARLTRKFGDFERRFEARPDDTQEPRSPALPAARPALAAKADPLSGATPEDSPAQASRSTTTKKPKSGKMAIFTDDSNAESPSALGSKDSGKGWDSIGSIAGRKKENTTEAKPWAGETLKTGKTNTGVQKIAVFRSSNSSSRPAYESSNHQSQRSVNPKTGRAECVFVNLEAVYPNPRNPSVEYSFEELRAKHRGALDVDWSRVPREQTRAPEKALQPAQTVVDGKQKGFAIFHDGPLLETPEAVRPVHDQETIPVEEAVSQQQRGFAISHDDVENRIQTELPERPAAITIDSSLKVIPLRDENDENKPPLQRDADILKRMRREERANRTRKIKVMEVEHVQKETQTVKLNLASPTGPKKRMKKVADPTMTINTREAMDEIYGIFSQPVKVEEEDAEESDSDIDDSDDDYTSAGESTGTGHISEAASDYGEETKREIFASQNKLEDEPERETTNDEHNNAQDDDDQEKTDVSAWSDYTSSKPSLRKEEETDTSVYDDQGDEASEPDLPTATDGLATPYDDEEDEEPKTRYIPLPPEDYEPVRGQYRDPVLVANNRLPFMTPIVEHTESSIGTATGHTEKGYFTAKTPSRKQHDSVDLIPIDEDEDNLFSSPFQEVLNGVAEDKKKLLKPIRTKTTKGMVALGGGKEQKPKLLGRSLKNAAQEAAPSKGPIVTDPQVNPVDPELRNSILAQVRPPLSSYDGYYEHLEQTSARVPEIRKYAKAVAKAGKLNSEKMSPSLTTAPVLQFAGTESVYTLKRELGAGAFAPVYLVENSNADASDEKTSNTSENDDDEDGENLAPARMGQGAFAAVRRHALEAVKMEDPPSAWEFYMIRQAHRRLGVSRATESIVHAYEMHMFRDEGFLVEEYRSQGTLLDLVNIARADAAGAMEEALAMFFAVELLRTVEAMHKHGVIHGDLKGDNVLVRFEDLAASDTAAWSAQYKRDGSHSWKAKGVTLIDFGRGIDMKVFGAGTQFVADWPTSSADCPEMREMRPWTYQVDYHGLAGLLHSLLFGKYMSTIAERGGGLGQGATKTYRIRESLKRYWQTEIWSEVFSLLLNPLANLEAEEGRRMPLVRGLKSVREKMEAWLEVNCERGIGLKGMIRKMEEQVKTRKR